MKSYLALIGGMVLVVIGSILGYEQVTAFAQQPSAPSSNVAYAAAGEPQQAANYVGGKPVRIVVPAVGIDVPVVDGIYNTRSRTWSLSETAAQYALITPEANNSSGNTFIYAHNRQNLFGPLLKLPVGSLVMVYTSNQHIFTYKLNSSRVTKPTDDSLFYYHGSSMLTLQTCSGLWFQNRTLLSFDFVEVR